MQYKEITCKSAINKVNTKSLPYKNDLNIYRGCQHRCKYCFALYSHGYMEDNNFFDNIYVKKNVVDELEKELRKKSWKRDVVNIGGVTDSYQPCEKEYKIMPEILKLLIKYKTPAIISTKSNLILRDYDLIDELSRITYINIACTITTMDEKVRRKLESGAVSSVDRLKVLKEFKKTNASVGIHNMPIVPLLTDSYENLDAIYHNAKIIDVDYVLSFAMNLRGITRTNYLQFIKQEYPSIYGKYLELYKNGHLDKEYKKELYKKVNEIRNKYNIDNNYMKAMKKRLLVEESDQISFW